MSLILKYAATLAVLSLVVGCASSPEISSSGIACKSNEKLNSEQDCVRREPSHHFDRGGRP